jgi:hypothetical protein
MISIESQKPTGGLNDIVNLNDNTEVSIKNGKYVAGGVKPTGFFSSLTMAFRCFFRSKDEVIKNNAVFEQVKQDIDNIFGEKIANKFNDEMQSKIDMGSPLTKGALMRFLKKEKLVIPSEATPAAVANNIAPSNNSSIQEGNNFKEKKAVTSNTNSIKNEHPAANGNSQVGNGLSSAYEVRGKNIKNVAEKGERLVEGAQVNNEFSTELRKNVEKKAEAYSFVPDPVEVPAKIYNFSAKIYNLLVGNKEK